MFLKLTKVYAFCLIAISLSLSAISQNINSLTAKDVAFNFIKAHNQDVKSPTDFDLIYSENILNNDTAWYVFAANNKGYIIISAEESAYPILAYSFDSNFDKDKSNFPPAFTDWMEWRTQEIEFLKQNKHTADDETSKLWKELKEGKYTIEGEKSRNITPLLLSKWNQDCNYNALCPVDSAGPCQKVYAGCVATAMGQIMYYWRYPATGIGSKSYYSDYGLLTANFGQTNYNWNEMKGSINTYHHELAKVLYHLGISVSMMYSPTGSGAYSQDVPNAMVSYFGYNQSAIRRSKNQFTNANWENLLKSNLDKKWPMYYSGSGSGGGHAFVCDGYQGTNHFHFDWGWSGSYNGYFYLNNLNPGTNTFNNNQAVVVEIVPSDLSYLNNNSSAQHILTGVSGSFEDGSGAMYSYSPNSNIQWLIQPSVPVDNIKLNFVYFETENDSDFVTIYEGPTTSDPILGVFSGNNLPSTITTNGQSMLITFSSNSSIEARGFLAEYSATTTKFCSGVQVIEDEFGTIEDGSGTWNYGNNTNCRWIIQPPGANIINLSFNYFSTEPTNDRLLIRNFETGNLVAEFSGSNIPSDLTIYSSKIQLHFITNSSINSNGWSINFSSSTSIDDIASTDLISIYPNPANEFFIIESKNENLFFETIKVYDLTGRLVLNQEINNKTNYQRIDTSNLKQGTYFVKILVNNEIINKKLIIN